VYFRRGSLLAVPFDAERLTARPGAASIVENDVAPSLGGASGAAQFSVANDSTLVYVDLSSTGLSSSARFFWVDRMGRETPIDTLPRVYLAPAISPDGDRVAYQTTQGTNIDIWIYEFRRGITQRLTTAPGTDSDGVWSPDGKRIAYQVRGNDGGGIFLRAADGTGDIERLTTGRHVPTSWSSDGTRIFYTDFGSNVPGPTTPSDIAVVTLNGARRTETLVATAARESNAEIAPNGRWLAYETTETGEKAVHVRPFPDVSARQWRVSTSGGVGPRWSRDGSKLFYRNGRAIMAVSVQGATPDDWSAPEKLFEGTYFFIEGPRMFDVARDGRFLMVKAGSDDATIPTRDSIMVVQNWTDALKERVPVD
jgi:serine/threonine-protein kinase